MRSLSGLPFEDVAYEVCSAFDRAGILAVLVGGGAATFYAPKAYQTRDLDFVLHLELFGSPATILTGLGFVPTRTGGTYEHPDTPFTLEILKGPLSVGDETLEAWETYRKVDLVLHVVSATDCVKDRLAATIHFRDLSSARQAAEVAKRQPIDREAVRAWCANEGGEKAFSFFESLLER